MDAAKISYSERVKEDAEIYDKTIEAIKKGIKQRESLSNYVEEIAKPNPALICILTFIILVVIYLLYIACIKPSPAGKWLDEADDTWIIKHEKYSSDIICKSLDETKGILKGKISGQSLLFDNGFIGIWRAPDIIELYYDGDLILTLRKIIN